jgi:hypothetical protein
LYEAGGNGDLDFVKDGAKTAVTTDSIIRYLGRMQSAKIKAAPARKWATKPRRSNKSQESHGNP